MERSLEVSSSADRNNYEIFGEPRTALCTSRIGRPISNRPKPGVLEALGRLMAKVA
jgi:hypothetical protein